MKTDYGKGKTGNARHDELLRVMIKLPSDYEPWGKTEYEYGDCSCGCIFYARLYNGGGDPSNDWGVCLNRKSHRCGMLTFEHQGCTHYTP